MEGRGARIEPGVIANIPILPKCKNFLVVKKTGSFVARFFTTPPTSGAFGPLGGVICFFWRIHSFLGEEEEEISLNNCE